MHDYRVGSGATRREVIKKGLALGGSLVWATPVVQAIGIRPALAETVSNDEEMCQVEVFESPWLNWKATLLLPQSVCECLNEKVDTYGTNPLMALVACLILEKHDGHHGLSAGRSSAISLSQVQTSSDDPEQQVLEEAIWQRLYEDGVRFREPTAVIEISGIDVEVTVPDYLLDD